MLTDIAERMRSHIKYRMARRVLAKNIFVNEDVGPINEISAVNQFVISIPKCGTTAIQRGFERLGHHVIHAHNDPTTYEAFANGSLLRGAKIDLETLVGLRRRASADPIHFFLGYREPVSWYLSVAGHFRLPLTEELRSQIVHNLHHEYPWNKYRFGDTREIVERASGMKLFAEPFNANRGYTVQRKDNMYLVVYRADRMNELGSYIRNNIDGKFEMNTERANCEQGYVAYVRKTRIPLESLQKLYSCKIFSYFYSRDEAAKMISKYIAEPASETLPVLRSRDGRPGRTKVALDTATAHSMGASL